MYEWIVPGLKRQVGREHAKAKDGAAAKPIANTKIPPDEKNIFINLTELC